MTREHIAPDGHGVSGSSKNVINLSAPDTPYPQRFVPPPAILNYEVNSLASSYPKESAKHLLTRFQGAVGAAFLMLCALAAMLWPIAAFITFNAITAFYFTLVIVFRFWLLLLGWREKIEGAPLHILHDEDLPVITILLPLYRDAAALPLLAQHVDKIDYPESKKDVKLLLEEDDWDIEGLRSMCDDMGYDGLATVRNESDNTFLSEFAPSSMGFLVGGNDIASEGTWVWESGLPMSFTNWASGEPNNGGGEEHCLALHGVGHGGGWTYKWNDTFCSMTGAVRYVCESR